MDESASKDGRKKSKLAVGVGIAIVGVAVAVLIAVFFWSGEAEDDSRRLPEMVDATVEYHRQNHPEPQSWWQLIALKSAGEDLRDDPWKDPALPHLEEGSAPTDFAAAILAMLALDKNPAEDWPGLDPVAELQEMQKEDGSFGGGLNYTIWPMIALGAADSEEFAESGAEEAVKYLLQQQLEDGGFALSGKAGDPDVTAMAIQALMIYEGLLPEIDSAVEEALLFLQDKQLPEGGFASYGTENANSISVVISALLAADEYPLGPEWRKEDTVGSHDMLSALQRFQLEDGSFTYLLEPARPNPMATSQALIALGDLMAGEPIWTRLQEGERP